MSVRQVFAERLIQLREESGLSRQQVADDLQISRASLEYYEKEKRAPDIETLYNIAEYFHTSADYLLGRTPNKTIDAELQAACEYTGLSEKAIENICKMSKKTFGFWFLTLQFLIENALSDSCENNEDSLIYRLTAYYYVQFDETKKYLTNWGSSIVRASSNLTPLQKALSLSIIPEKELIEQALLEGIRQAAKTEKVIFEREYLGVETKKGE